MTHAALGAQFGFPPHAPGEGPVPEGTDRLFHMTHADNFESIKKTGLQPSKSTRGDGSVYLSHTPFFDGPEGMGVIEVGFSGTDSLDPGPVPNSAVSRTTIPPDKFLAVHEPWQIKVRDMLREEPRLVQELKDGKHDAILQPDSGIPEHERRAYQHLKDHG
jgi:hypothetical protein